MKSVNAKKLGALGINNNATGQSDEGLFVSHNDVTQRNAFVPPFAFNDEQLRLVLCYRAWRYVHHHAEPPTSWNYEACNKAATKRALAGYDIDETAVEQIEIQNDHKKAVRRAGGYMELQASIAFKSWRLGMPSPEVALACRVSPWQVRQSLRRLRGIAAKLGFDVGRRHHSLRAGTVSHGSISY
jgi:hypothetical protein